MYAFGATIGPAVAGLCNEFGGIEAYIWMGICLASVAVSFNLVISYSMRRSAAYLGRSNAGLDLSMQQNLLPPKQDEEN